MKHAIRCALAILLILLFSGSARADGIHTVIIKCGGYGMAGMRDGQNVELELIPATEIRSSDGEAWTIEEIRNLPDLRVTGASMRFAAEKVDGIQLEYALAYGDIRSVPQRVLTGGNLWDVTAPVSAWIASGDDELRIVPAYQRTTRSIRIGKDSVRLQVTFSTSASLPDFRLDKVQEEAVYDASLTLLEADSPFITRYQDTGESLLRPISEYGIPYYFGGHSEEKYLHRYYPVQVSDYYRKGRLYLCGLDCTGLTQLVMEKCGMKKHPGIRTLLARGMGTEALKNNDPGKWMFLLQPGDLIAVNHGTLHIMIYIGTLRTFGWTEADAGEAAEVLDYPLVIHCGGNPFYYDRYREYISEQGYRDTWPPDGGVTVSVILPSDKNAPHSLDTEWGKHFGWYLADGHPLLVFPLNDCTEIAWYEPEPNPE